MATINYPGVPGTPLYGGRASAVVPTPGSVFTTLTLNNTSVTEQAADFVSPMFGLPIKQGDVPAGEYPIFETTGGVSCPATIWGVTSWPDGSMKFCGAMIRVPAAVAGSGTLTINVKAGGVAPSASSRSVSDLVASDISTELVGVTNLTGTWSASLNTAISDADDIVVIGDGPAGKVWRIGGPFKQGGTAHGQLHCWHYVAALQNSSGTLAGIRYLGRVAQPWGDVTSPEATYRRVTGSLKSGASTIRSLQGTTTGEVVGANIDIDHYTSFFTAGSTARWDFVQGGGSAPADCTVRVVQNKAYMVKSRLLPSYDTSLSVSSSTAVSYVPYGLAPQAQRDMPGTGGRGDIGIQPEWVARHILTQSAADETTVRTGGLISAGWTTCLRKQATKQIVPVSDISASYAGLGPVETGWRFIRPSYVGMVAPAAAATLWIGSYEPSHRPASTYYPYLITGEPQYLDMMVEHASTLVTIQDPAYRNATVAGTTYKAAALLINGELLRIPAWGLRDIAEAAAIYPDTCPSGTESRKYLRDVLESNYAAAAAVNASKSQAWRDNGRWGFIADGSTQADYESPWAFGYLALSFAHQAAILGSSGAIAMRQHLARFYQSVHAAGDIAAMVSYRCSQRDQNGVEQDTAAGMVFGIDGTLTFDTATNRGTVSGFWSPTNGDVYAFVQPFGHTIPFSGVSYLQRLYVVNASGKTFQLSATPGGAPLTVASNMTTGLMALLKGFSGGSGHGTDSDYWGILYSTLRNLEASGDVGVNTARLVHESRIASSGFSPTSSTKHAMAATYPE